MRMRLLLPAAFVALFSVAQADAQSTMVSCGPGQQAVIRSTFTGGEQVTRVQCVGAGSGATIRNAASRTQVERVRVAPKKRSWGKSALVIGGSAGTGAGVGAIVKGKKGALIGAALGGGAASIYEGARRR